MLKIRLLLQVCLVLIIPFTVSASIINDLTFDSQGNLTFNSRLVDSHFTADSRHMTHRNSGYEENPIQQHRNFKSFFSALIQTNFLMIQEGFTHFSHLMQRSSKFKYIDLPPELWDHIASFLDCKTKLHHVNRYLFTAVTTYPWTDILKKGFAHLDTLPRPSGCKLKGATINFSQYSNDTIPSYILYSLVEEARFLKQPCWPYLVKTRIDKLDLLGQKFGTDGVTALATILPLTKIHTLDLCINKIGSAGAKVLAQALPLTHLKSIILSCNDFGDEGCIALAKVLPSTDINTINLGSNIIGLKGTKALANVLPSTRIHTLSLFNNNIGDDEALALAEVLCNSKISNLNLKLNRISANLKQQLKSQFPHITFEL